MELKDERWRRTERLQVVGGEAGDTFFDLPLQNIGLVKIVKNVRLSRLPVQDHQEGWSTI